MCLVTDDGYQLKDFMNPLMNLIKEVDPGYPEPLSNETMTIYCHQQAAIKELIELGKRPVCSFVGMTKTYRGFARFDDGDYSHLPEEVIPDFMIPVHKDITDHYIRAELYSLGFRKSTLGGSNEVVESPLHIKTYSEMISFIRSIILNIDKRFKEYQKTFGFTPESHKKLIKEKNPEAIRAPKLHLVNFIVKKLNNLPKDAKIYVPQDAFGHFSITLSNLGYLNIFTDSDYEMNPTGMSNIPNSIKYITRDEYSNMNDFDAVIGNPPYGKGGRLALQFLNECVDKVREKKGQIILVLPKSIKQGSSNYNKINRELELVWTKDCKDNDFAASIDACIQEWKIGDKLREIDVEYKEHPHIEFLSYENRYDADIFVGGDGAGASGKVFLPGEKNSGGKKWTDYEKSVSHNYIKVLPDENNTKEQILERIISLGQKGDNTFRETSMGTTNGIPHLGKTKLITIYTKRYGNGH